MKKEMKTWVTMLAAIAIVVTAANAGNLRATAQERAKAPGRASASAAAPRGRTSLDIPARREPPARAIPQAATAVPVPSKPVEMPSAVSASPMNRLTLRGSELPSRISAPQTQRAPSTLDRPSATQAETFAARSRASGTSRPPVEADRTRSIESLRSSPRPERPTRSADAPSREGAVQTGEGNRLVYPSPQPRQSVQAPGRDVFTVTRRLGVRSGSPAVVEKKTTGNAVSTVSTRPGRLTRIVLPGEKAADRSASRIAPPMRPQVSSRPTLKPRGAADLSKSSIGRTVPVAVSPAPPNVRHAIIDGGAPYRADSSLRRVNYGGSAHRADRGHRGFREDYGHHRRYSYSWPYFGLCWRPTWRTCGTVVVYPWWPSCAWDSYFRVSYSSSHWSFSLSCNRPCYTSRSWCGPTVVKRYYIYSEAPSYYWYDVYDTVDRLTDRLRYGDIETRRDAARELGEWRSSKALYPLIYAIEYDEDPLVRFYAAKSLGKLGAREALPVLEKAVNQDAELFVRDEAAEAIDLILN